MNFHFKIMMYYFAEQQFIEFMLLRELILLLTDPFFEMA